MAPLSFHVEALLPSSIAPKKLDSLLHSHVYPQVAAVLRAVARFKALLLHAIDDLNNNNNNNKSGRPGKKKMARFVKLQFFGTARARRVVVDRLPPDTNDRARRSSYYDERSAWNAAAAEEVEVRGDGGTAAECCGYLCWLEEEEERPSGAGDGEEGEEEEEVNEIDRLAERFIERFHAKCLLEKQESYRRRHLIATTI
ncbi:uncharacterized protein LOC104581459 [Brachypodium distachyon]|uniref:Uncharacterized protein n=1 Tax=Brachypodium distachyon TaxID=15368 RepID=I1J333_BRADI|nr:uncharacterized protein LOC104581459 [Brachypodium distachyon]KQJ85168.1 hypothetical protein BRADI_5g25330v3 [Brachypodium distachyon]|eukprot:XP_024312010.1 uncharacterized protein LOC104581459 [Brachypodium distachyon]